MKANKGQIERALDAPPADIRLFLLYGPDESGSAALAKRLERAMGPDAERIDLDASTLKGDPARLADEAAALSMFGDKRWIRVMPAGDEIVPAVEALMQASQAGNPVVAVAGALKGTSKLVKLCLENKAVMACISYVPEGRDAEQIAIGIARDRGLRLSPDLARRITALAGGDRALMAGEIEKVALYLDAAPDRPAEATAEVLNALSADSVDEDGGALVNAVLGGDLRTMNREMVRAGSNLAAVLRPLQNRAMLIAGIRADFDRSGRVDEAVKAAGKAVFWKDEKAVQRQVRLWDCAGIARVIARLGAAERASRSGRGAADVLVAHELLAIARQAARER
ncbi:DNA polymerase III subunit delta [Sphingobium aquiterrae]|uniref:DNA polymerase III subunit delta n=1 Tax=Sphingobium aquiterrae TaxID=2038656 RepID=UPI00301A6F7D